MIKSFVTFLFLLNFAASFHFQNVFKNNQYNNKYVSKKYANKNDKLTSSEPLTDELTSNDASFVRINIPSIHGSPATFPRRQLQSGEPSLEDIVSADELSGAQFGSIFTQCAPYIAQHRGSVMVLHIPSKMFLPENKELFDLVMDDISLLHLLGVQIILVAGVRELLDQRLRLEEDMSVAYHDGMRVTDDRTMNLLKELSGSVRFEVESALGRGFRGAASSQHGAINVVSGNLFYSAKPVGVRNGIDFRLSGEVRKIETDNVRRRLEGGDVVLLTSLGHSHSGEVFNVPSELLAAECGAKLKASKVIFLTEGEYLTDTRTGRVIQSLRLAQAVSLLETLGLHSPPSSPVDLSDSASNNDSEIQQQWQHGPLKAVVVAQSPQIGPFVHQIFRCVHALSGGVRRAHLVPASRGSLLKELFTRDGAGVLISRDVYEGIRPAGPSDVRTVEDIIRPLENDGILIKRDRDKLERDMPHFYLMVRDGTTLACGMLKLYGTEHAEISCLAVRPEHRKEGRGETMLGYLERRALILGAKYAFVLSTRTMQWFEERGYVAADPSQLPPSRQYDKARNSKVYIKTLGSSRDMDAEELLWNV